MVHALVHAAPALVSTPISAAPSLPARARNFLRSPHLSSVYALAFFLTLAFQPPQLNPYYTPDSIANSAASIAGLYAPNTLVTIYGLNLSNAGSPVSLKNVNGGSLPTTLTGANVRVLVNHIPANLYYISPTQINLLIPPLLAAGPALVEVEVEALTTLHPVTIMLGDTAPALFMLDSSLVLASHGDYSLVTNDSPAHANEEIVLYATGLGVTSPPPIENQVPALPAPLVAKNDFQVWLNGVAVDPASIEYAGAVAGYAGLFQINVSLPANSPSNPEIRVGTSALMSPPNRFLAVQ